MIRPPLRRLAIPVILTALTACDNVSWGGIDVHLQAPPGAADTARVDTVAPEPDAPPPLELGPVLYAVRREGESTELTPVAEIAADGLRPLPTEETVDFESRFRRERLAPDTRFALFASGVRVGTFHAVGPAPPDTTLCAPRPRVAGRVEIQPRAVDAPRLLAVDDPEILERPLGDFRPRVHTREERVASLNVAAVVFNRLGAPWPAGLVESRGDIQVFRPGGAAPRPSIAATFLFRDDLEIGAAPASAWAIFFIAEPGADRYDSDFVWYRTAGEEGKGAPRFWEHADWDGDSAEEILLEVLGRDSRWFAALERRADGWARTYQDPCGAPEVQAAAAVSSP